MHFLVRFLLLASWMLSTFTRTARAFVIHPRALPLQRVPTSSRTFTFPVHAPQNVPFTSKSSLTTSTALRAQVDQGIGRGIPILGLVLLACVWLFTIPPEFRRAYICPDSCAKVEYKNAPACQECVTGEEWINGVKEYYRNGGGIQWDFSIDPNSKMMIGKTQQQNDYTTQV